MTADRARRLLGDFASFINARPTRTADCRRRISTLLGYAAATDRLFDRDGFGQV